MLNLVLHITIPAGIRLVSGPTLQEPVTFDILSACDPFYASVNQVKLSGGPLIRKLQDITIASSIYNASQECDLLLVRKDHIHGDNLIRFQGAQNQWVQNAAARDLLMNITSGGAGAPAAHVLANFSITKQKGFESEGTPELLKDLKDGMKLYEVTLRSGGKASPGGHVKATMAGKGVMDWGERTPGRNWVVTGMGANGSTGGGHGGNGGRGKAVHFFGSPMFSGMMMGFRSGVWQSGSSLFATSPFSMSLNGAF
jgi:hypothetical protein